MKSLKLLLSTFMVLMITASPVFADITINGTKTVKTNSSTVFKVDDKVISETEFANQATGQIATVSAEDSGVGAEEVNAENHIKGPVTSLSPFQVFGQDVVINADTVLVGNNGTFALGDLLEVSGYFNTSNAFLATRVELKTTLENWKIFGYVQLANGNLLTIGQLTFDTSAMTLTDCGGGAFAAGALVKIKLAPITNFDPATTISVVNQFECKTELLDLPAAQTGDFEFEVEGFVSEIVDTNNFTVNGQKITVDASTIYSNGTKADIVLNTKLEADGLLDSATNTLTAVKIKFESTKVKVEGPVTVSDLDSNQVTIMGITGIFNAFTEDEAGLIANGLTASANIEIRGYVDSTGNIYVEELKNRGAADSNNVRLSGPADNLATNSFTILGIQVDTTNATFSMEDQSLDAATFYASLVKGSVVDIQQAQYDAQTNTITGGNISLENVNDSADSVGSVSSKYSNSTNAAAAASVNYGTVTAFQPAQATTPTPTPAPAASSGGGGSSGVLFFLLLGLGVVMKSRKIA